MRSMTLCCLVVVLSGCAGGNMAPPPEAKSPELIGVVTDSSGEPIPGVKVRVYTGLATYFPRPRADTQTDDRGAFHLSMTDGAALLDDEQPVSYSIGLCFDMEGLPAPGGGLHWTGLIPVNAREVRVRFQVADGAVQVVDDDA